MIKIEPKAYKYYPDLARGYVANQEYDKSIDILNRYLSVKKTDAEAWFQLGKIYADKGDFVEGIEIFQKVIKIDTKDPKKKLFLGMLLAEVNRFKEALEMLKKAVDQAPKKSVVRKRCEDLIQQILEVSGIKEDEAKKSLGSQLTRKIKRKKTKKKKYKAGSQKYVRTMLITGIRYFKKMQKAGWNKKNRKQLVKFIKYKLIHNYKQLIKFKKFTNPSTRRYYYLGIRRLIDLVKGKAKLKSGGSKSKSKKRSKKSSPAKKNASSESKKSTSAQKSPDKPTAKKTKKAKSDKK